MWRLQLVWLFAYLKVRNLSMVLKFEYESKIEYIVKVHRDGNSLVENRQELSPKGICLWCQVRTTQVNHIFLHSVF